VKRLLVVLVVVSTCTAPGYGQSPNLTKLVEKSLLLKKGLLQELRKPLESIFAFQLDGANG
jgi:hypothetical protein